MVASYQGATYHVDHVTPTSQGGANHADNYSWLCWACNTAKTDRVSCFDPETRAEVEMFDPRTMAWDEHFSWRGAVLVGSTPVGRGLIHTLALNTELRLRIRVMEQDMGEFPPPPATPPV